MRLAQTTAERYRDLITSDSVSRQDLDNANGTLEAREAAVESARANVRRLEQLQSFRRIEAPFAGVVTARNTDIGALIDSGSNAKELFHAAAVDRLRVFVNVPQVSRSLPDATSATRSRSSRDSGAMNGSSRTRPIRSRRDKSSVSSRRPSAGPVGRDAPRRRDGARRVRVRRRLRPERALLAAAAHAGRGVQGERQLEASAAARRRRPRRAVGHLRRSGARRARDEDRPLESDTESGRGAVRTGSRRRPRRARESISAGCRGARRQRDALVGEPRVRQVPRSVQRYRAAGRRVVRGRTSAHSSLIF